MSAPFVVPCHRCGEPSVKLCDECDKPLCLFCAVCKGNYFIDGKDMHYMDTFDYCPEHSK